MTATATGGIAGVLSRMAAIESRYAPPRTGAITSTTSSGTSFDAVLGSALDTASAGAGAGATSGTDRTGATGTTPRTSDSGATAFDDLFAQAGAAHGVDPALLRAVAQVESGLDPTAVSPAGAQGLMQLMPATADSLGVDDPFDPAQAIDGAARYLRQQLDRFGSVELALAAYNAGPGAVARHGGIPPYAETQTYVRRVLDRYGAA